MKKFAKITAITALVLAVLGLMLTIIGAFGGGAKLVKTLARDGGLSIGPEDFEWVEWIDGINIVIEDDSAVVFNDNYEIFTAGERQFSYSETEVENFEFRMAGGDIDIQVGDGENWTVEIDGIGKFQSYVEAGTLYVVGTHSGINVDVGDVLIKIPRSEYLGSADISLGAGEMDIAYLTADEMNIAVGAGDITVEKADVRNLEASVGAGEIDIESGKIGNAEVAVGMGAAYITGNITGNVDGGVSMGELCIEVQGSAANEHNYNVSCAAGEVEIGGKTYAGVGNSMEIDNGADTIYNLDCAMGRIEVSFKEQR